MTVWGHAGRHFTFTQGLPWYARVPFDQWALVDHAEVQKLLALMDPVWGDRRQELVIIGQNMDHAKVQASLEAALVSKEELAAGVQKLGDLQDPFPEWDEEEDDADEWIQ